MYAYMYMCTYRRTCIDIYINARTRTDSHTGKHMRTNTATYTNAYTAHTQKKIICAYMSKRAYRVARVHLCGHCKLLNFMHV